MGASAALTGMELWSQVPALPTEGPRRTGPCRGWQDRIVADPGEVAYDADVLYTDIWVSMGDEQERAERLQAFGATRLTRPCPASPDAFVMHCLPPTGREITDEVMEDRKHHLGSGRK